MRYCPSCGTEYVDEAQDCADCGVPLGDEPPQPADTVELCPVLNLASAGDIAVAKSMLEGAGIAYHMRGEGIHGLYGAGVAGTALFGPVQVHVDKARADEAVAILSTMIEEEWGEGEEPGGDGENDR